VEYLRITLWAYWPAGTCWFDDLRFEEAGPISADQKRHEDGVTHVGLPPDLGAAARTPTTSSPARESFDEEQAWQDAANALRTGDNGTAARLAEALIAHAPPKGTYRVLAARALAAVQRWNAAEQQAQWLLEEVDRSRPETAPREIEPWQRDWARVVLAQIRHHTGRSEEARALLRTLLESGVSPHAKAAAESLLAEIEGTRKK
jgi:thioredoxin-like negative regulator of GroEL